MTALREETLIRKGFYYFLLPSLAIGIIGIFIPFVYVVVPLHESDLCLCAFFSRNYICDNSWLLNKDNFCNFLNLN